MIEQELLDKFDNARRLLWIHGFITHSEREKITKRIIRWGKKVGLEIKRKQGFPQQKQSKK